MLVGSGAIQLTGTSVSSNITVASQSVVLVEGQIYYNTLDIESGTVQLDNPYALLSLNVTGASGAGTLDLNGQSVDTTVNLQNFSGTILNNGGPATVASNLGGNITLAGSGALTLSGTITGNLTLAGSGAVLLTGPETSSDT